MIKVKKKQKDAKCVLRSGQPLRTEVNLFNETQTRSLPSFKYGWHTSRHFAHGRAVYIPLYAYIILKFLVISFWCGIYGFIFLYLSNPCHNKVGHILFPVQENERRGCPYRSKVRPVLIRILASSLHVTSWDYLSGIGLTESCSLRP